MTADVEMLTELVDEGLDFFNLAGDEGDKLYVSAIRQHIAAKDAEIEALRAEVGELHMHAKRRDQYAVEKAAQALDWKKRAERLAEALRKIAALTEEFDDLDDATGIANEALEQEAGRG